MIFIYKQRIIFVRQFLFLKPFLLWKCCWSFWLIINFLHKILSWSNFSQTCRCRLRNVAFGKIFAHRKLHDWRLSSAFFNCVVIWIEKGFYIGNIFLLQFFIHKTLAFSKSKSFFVFFGLGESIRMCKTDVCKVELLYFEGLESLRFGERSGISKSLGGIRFRFVWGENYSRLLESLFVLLDGGICRLKDFPALFK